MCEYLVLAFFRSDTEEEREESVTFSRLNFPEKKGSHKRDFSFKNSPAQRHKRAQRDLQIALCLFASINLVILKSNDERVFFFTLNKRTHR